MLEDWLLERLSGGGRPSGTLSCSTFPALNFHALEPEASSVTKLVLISSTFFLENWAGFEAVGASLSTENWKLS